MQDEFNVKIENNNFCLKKKTEIPVSTQVLPGIWVLQQKCKIVTGEIYKWKVGLNLDQTCQVKGVHYDHTFAPVSKQLLLILAFAGVTFASHFLFPSVRWFFRVRAQRVVDRLNKPWGVPRLENTH